MAGDPVRWGALRRSLLCAVLGVVAIVIAQRTTFHGTHTVIGIEIKDEERKLLGEAGIVLLVGSVLLALSAFLQSDRPTRSLAGPATLLAIAVFVGAALVFSAYRVQQDTKVKRTAGTPPIVQVDCARNGGTCFNVTGQGGTYPGPPSGVDVVYNCTWSDIGLNKARTEEIYVCR